jgi:hypothetical protein
MEVFGCCLGLVQSVDADPVVCRHTCWVITVSAVVTTTVLAHMLDCGWTCF